MLRRIDYGEYDLIITFFTLNMGKISTIAKYAKKSVKRFSGILELFSVLQVVCSPGHGKGLPVLQEASLQRPFPKIRADIKKTAYASYWAELINEWLEDGKKQIRLYHLFQYVLNELDLGQAPESAVSILFQMRFMSISGFCPNLRHCCICGTETKNIKKDKIFFNIEKGGLVCENCVPGSSGTSGNIYLSKGTIKQLLWVGNGDLAKAKRLRFSHNALNESTKFLEAFVPYHLGRETKSLKILKQLRQE